MTRPTIFISYSHIDEQWKDKLVTHLGVLQEQGYLDIWVDTRIKGGADWFREIKEAIEATSIAVLLISADFLNSKFITEEEVPMLLQQRQKKGLRIIPIILKHCDWLGVPWLVQFMARPQDGRPLASGSENQIEAELAGIAKEIRELMAKSGVRPEQKEYYPLAPDKISTSKLPITSPLLFGREEELKMLDAAWEDEGTKIVSLVAWGGVGKTALVNVWLNHMGKDQFRGAERVLGYSFYSQGAAEGKQASADPFIHFALTWFGDPDPTLGSPWDKGVRLAGLICQQRTLIILDGLEPVQYPPGVMEGRLKDPALQSLLRELMRHNPGLCIITTRLAVADLQPCEGSTVLSKNLEHLSTAAGAHLLSHLGVTGKPIELQHAADEFDGHALTLTLLGRYLAVAYQGDIRQRDRIGRITKEKKQGAHAFKVMEAYERWFQGKPELNILYLMGLFDRPAPGGAIAALKAEPAINGLTAALVQLPDEDWRYALNSLREVRLLAKQDPDDPDTLDCHPLIREHFSQKLREQAPGAWRIAHERLYDYYKHLPEKELPDKLEEMEPLFAAVAHGCQAKKYKEAIFDVFWPRIRRTNEGYSVHKLGAFGSDLASLSNFFEIPWNKIAPELKDDEKAAILSWSGFHLRALGRLREAAQPMQAGMENSIKQKDWEGAAQDAGNLSELYLTLGDVAAAVASARQSVDFADRSGDGFQKWSKRKDYANALFNAGEISEAEQIFQKSETILKENSDQTILFGLGGFLFCDLLLSQGKVREVLERAKQTLESGKAGYSLLAFALDKLSLGRAYLLEAVNQKPQRSQRPLRFDQAADYLNQAVAGLRESGYQYYIPLGLFARAFCYRIQNQFPQAWGDLAEAREIAERGDMKLWLVDYHLEAARLLISEFGFRDVDRQHTVGTYHVETFHEMSLHDTSAHETSVHDTSAHETYVHDTSVHETSLQNAHDHLNQAAELVQKTGYHRRDPEVELGYAALFLAQGELGRARERLGRAKELLDKKGIRQWDWEVKRLEEVIG